MIVPFGGVAVLNGANFGYFFIGVFLQKNNAGLCASVRLEGVAVQTHNRQDAGFAEKKVTDG